MKTSFHINKNPQKPSSPITSPKAFDALLEDIGDSKIVLLGEASHGTHEFYTWRTEISKRLIEEKGFSFIAVEGDWPDCYTINRFVKGYTNSGEKIHDVLNTFHRWPTWMWANWEIAALAEWLTQHNTHISKEKKVGFYGLDVYSLWDSLHAIIRFLKEKDPASLPIAQRALECFEPYGEEGAGYARASRIYDISCREELIQLLISLRKKTKGYLGDLEEKFNAEQNAHVALNAEEYYTSMVSLGPDSWNIRDQHMSETLNRLLNFHGPDTKAIVWEHNTHIGDARATDMKEEGMWNIGQLAREQHEKSGVYIVGFGSFQGTVIAGTEWGAPMEIMPLPPARPGSIENILHRESEEDRILLFNRDKEPIFKKFIPHRAVGVVYHPSREKYGNYVPTILSERYDAFVYIDTTTALHPLHLHPYGTQIPDTYPFGM